MGSLAFLWFQVIPSMDAVVSSFPSFAGEIFTYEGNGHPHLIGQPVYLWSQEFDTSLGCTVKCLTLLWFQGIPFMDAVVSPFPRFAGEILTFRECYPHLME